VKIVIDESRLFVLYCKLLWQVKIIGELFK